MTLLTDNRRAAASPSPNGLRPHILHHHHHRTTPPNLRTETTANLLIETLAHYRDQQKFLLHEFVIMPDHVHALLTPSPEISLERAMQFIKGGFSYRLKDRPVWQEASPIIASAISRITSIIGITFA